MSLAEGAALVVDWLAPIPRMALVLDDMQLVSVKVAVALCADPAVAPGDLGEMAGQRVPLGPAMNALCGRLRLLGTPWVCPESALTAGARLRLAARDGERVDTMPTGAGDGGVAGRRATVPPGSGRVVVRLSAAERGLLRAACERLLGLLDGRVLGLSGGRAHAVRGAVEAVLSELRQADAGAPDPGAPDAGAPDPGAPDPGAPDPGAPDLGAPGKAGGRSARALTPSSFLAAVRATSALRADRASVTGRGGIGATRR
jgi:hypothetical protein